MCPGYNISARTNRTHRFLLLLKSFPWERVLFAKALSSNGSGIFAYLAVVTEQRMLFHCLFVVVTQLRLYMLEYKTSSETYNKALCVCVGKVDCNKW
jgi:hypothetical protein